MTKNNLDSQITNKDLGRAVTAILKHMDNMIHDLKKWTKTNLTVSGKESNKLKSKVDKYVTT